MEALANARVLLDEGFVEGRVVLVEDGCIVDVVAPSDPRCAAARIRDLGGRLLMPGFVDVQVNGGGGVLFNDAPDVAAIEAIGRAHRRFGTTGFLPTLISDDLAVVERAIDAVREAIEARVPGVEGIHLEGPFLSEAKKGTHDASKFRELDAAAVDLLSSLGVGRTLVTLAPEETTPEAIAQLVRNGVIVSAGHTNATYAQVRAALDHGLRGFTHLYNAMSPLTSREPGAVGAALNDAASWCGVIADGVHVDPVALQIALRCKPRGRVMLVTDAMSTVGTDATEFTLQGKRILLRDGRLVDEAGVLSGSALDMARAVRNAVSMLGVDLAEGVRMASAYPAEFLGLGTSLGRIAPGYRANLVAATPDLAIHETWIGGRATAP